MDQGSVTSGHDLREQARALLECLAARFPLGYVPTLEWRRYRTTAGTANFQNGSIALSTLIITDRERLEDTLIHEYAHLLAFARAGARGKGHGAVWSQAMKDLGREPKVHHKYSCQRNQTRQTIYYRCKRCGVMIPRRRRLPKRRRYVHAECGGVIEFYAAQSATTIQVPA